MIAYSSDTSIYDNYALTSPTSVFYYNSSAVEEQDLIFDKIVSTNLGIFSSEIFPFGLFSILNNI